MSEFIPGEDNLNRLVELEQALIQDAMLFDQVAGEVGVAEFTPLSLHAERGVARWRTEYAPISLHSDPDGNPGAWELQLIQDGAHVPRDMHTPGDTPWISVLTMRMIIGSPNMTSEPSPEITLPDTTLHVAGGMPVRRLADPVRLYRGVMSGDPMEDLEAGRRVFAAWLEAARRQLCLERLDFTPSTWADFI